MAWPSIGPGSHRLVEAESRLAERVHCGKLGRLKPPGTGSCQVVHQGSLRYASDRRGGKIHQRATQVCSVSTRHPLRRVPGRGLPGASPFLQSSASVLAGFRHWQPDMTRNRPFTRRCLVQSGGCDTPILSRSPVGLSAARALRQRQPVRAWLRPLPFRVLRHEREP